MILARLIPKNSQRYQDINKNVSIYADLVEKFNILHLFSVWIITITGFSYMLGQLDRYSYWEWSGYIDGTIRLILSTVLFYVTTNTKILKLSNTRIKYSALFFNSIIGFAYFLIGAANINLFSNNIIGFLPYLFVLFSGIVIYEFKISYNEENDDWEIDSWKNNISLLSISLLFMALSAIFGYQLDDPVISTVSMVSLFFPTVALVWPNHVRHIKRLQFYPLFILGMFSCVRSPWFLIILWLLFFTIRSINYLKYGITHPSFGVTQEEPLADA